MYNSPKLLKLFALVLLLASCTEREPPANDITASLKFPSTITVQGNRFVDNLGRHVILNGINVVSKSPQEQYLFQGGPDFYANLKKWGINCIRFIVIWDGLETEMGVYNEAYLKEIDKRIKWAGDQGLFVVLDMHQDLFSVKYSDGAPEWATLDEDKTHQTGAIWSDSYMISEAVQTSFDNFWANKPAADGVGVQDHYVALWKHIAKRYAYNSMVIGYDLMNEPFPGSTALQFTRALLTAYGELIYSLTGKVMSEQELANTWGNEESRTEALKILSTRENYSRVFDALYELNKTFESTQLQQMYQKVSNGIRTVDPNHIIFLEHSYYSNTGVRSSIERVTLSDGTPDSLLAYAPHGYDLVTDTEDAAASESARVAFIYDRIREKGLQLNMPVWLGEWGAYYDHAEAIVPIARYAISLIEQNLFGHAYWSYNPGTENLEYFKEALLRPFPAYTNGNLLKYKFLHNESKFQLEWEEAVGITAPTVVYVPWISRVNQEDLQRSVGASIEKIEDSDAGWVIIPATGNNGKRALDIEFL